MRFWVAVTDNDWFRFLASTPGIDEVNFWHPSGRPPFGSLPEGTPFLFKLKHPYHHIAGGGYFIKYESLPLPLAWDAFGEKNGAASQRDLERLILPRRRTTAGIPEIGCSILGEPFFLPREDWIPVSGDFAGNIVVGKTYDVAEVSGKRIWDAIQTRLERRRLGLESLMEGRARYGAPVLVKPRRGQGTFRALVTNAYDRKCAITGETTLPVLEAAHIRPFATEGTNNTCNGMLLRSDFHKLFDIGLVTVSPEMRVHVSDRIKEQWYNGRVYYRLHGQPLASLPRDEMDRPLKDLLRWHNETVFERDAGGGHEYAT